MTLHLTNEQHLLLEAADAPPTVVDPVTGAAYVLLRAEVYERIKRLLEFSPAEAYPAVDRTFAEGWDDPKMAEYDRYEEHKR